MNAEIKRRFEALERRRVAMTEKVRAMTPAQQNSRPDKRAFSPVEVLMHFALAEQGNLQYLRNNPPLTLQSQKPQLRFMYRRVVAAMQAADKRIATAPYMVPKGPISVDEADRAWSAARAELSGYLNDAASPDDAFCKFMLFFGLGSADDFLTLMEAHMHYHEKRFPAVR